MHFYKSRRINRRQLAAGSAALAAVPLLPGISLAAQDASPEAEGEEQLEIFSWWTNPGEVDGLEALFDHFAESNPDVEIVNAAVAGGAGANAQLALQTRLNGGDPPDSWQSHPGEELFSNYVDPGYTEPVTELWDEQGWEEVYPQGIIDQVTLDGEKYLVPVGVHRGNVMFFNQQVLEENGLAINGEMTVDDFFEIADTLEAAGITTLALGNAEAFAGPQLFENILFGHLGADGYNGLWDGSLGWDDASVTEAIDIFGRMLDYSNDDYSGLTWDAASDLVIEGRAAMTSMGDWAWGYFAGQEVDDQIGYVTHPDTAGGFVAVVDGFTMPAGAPHPVNARNWLITCGTPEAQAAFAPFKGAIPARVDIDTSDFNEYMQWSAGDFVDGDVVASMAHGAAASPQFRTSILEATNSYLAFKDAELFQEELVLAAEDDGLGQ